MNQDLLIKLEKAAEKLVLDFPASLDCPEYTALFNEKFAQLIVRECIRLCDQVDIVGADECIDNIKQHFGVEE